MRVAIVRQAVTTFATGAWDFTASGYGTCIGASFKISGGLSDITPTNGARMGLGFTDGTNSRAGSWVSQNGQATTVSRRYKSASHCLLLVDPAGTVHGSATFDSFITDGIRINIDDSFTSAFFVEARLYFDDGGDDTFVGTVDMSSGTVDVTSVGFRFAFLEGFSTFQATAGAGADNAKFTMGFAVRNPSLSIATQGSLAFYEAHGAADGAPSARADNAHFIREIEDASVLGAVQISDVDSTGFTATQVNSAAFEFYYLAVKCNNQVNLSFPRSADATGTLSHNNPAFRPIAAFGWNSKLSALNSNAEDGRAGAWGAWQTTGSSSQFNSSIAVEDASTMTDCQSVNDDAFPYLPDHDGGTTTAIIGSVTGFTATGMDVNYTTVDSVRCYFSMLSIGGFAVVPASGTATFNAVDPTVVLGAMSVIPAAASALMLAIAPSALLGSVAVTPPSGTATFASRAPVVVLGSVAAFPAAGVATYLGVDPAVVFGSVSVAPAAGSASFVGVDPVAVLGSVAVTPLSGSALFLAADPTVDAGVPIVLATVTAYETRVGFNYLHGTIPVPDDWVETSLFLRDPDGNPLPTEQHIVERGPTGNTRVLELRARGENPVIGGAKTYSVEEGFVPADPGWGFHNNITINIQTDAPNSKTDQSIVQFSSQLLRGEPSTGNAWDVTRTIRRFGQLQSSSGSPLFGYEAFVTTVAGEPDVWLFEMTVQNGNVGSPGAPLGSNALHDVFFNEIRLDLSADYEILHMIPTPYTSNKKLMTPNGDGTQHCIEIGGSHEYRFVVYHTSKFARASVLLNMFGFFVCDFSKTKWSWHNRKTAWFGPRGSFVAQADLTNYLPYGVAWAGPSGLAAALAGGNPIFLDSNGNSTPMGPFHARGVTGGTQSGGVSIFAYVGHEVVNGGSINKLKTLMAIESLDRDRQSGKPGGILQGISLVGNDQAPIDPAQWGLGSCFTNSPGKFSTSNPGPFNRAAADTWRLDTIASYGGLPAWYGQKMGFAPHEYSHYIRGLSATLPLIWLRNDPLAKSYLRQMAAWSRILNLEYGLGQLWTSWSSADGVDALPGLGSSVGGRYNGWSFMVMAVDYQIGTDAKRANYANWYNLFIPHQEEAQLPFPGSGNWHATAGTGHVAALAVAWTQNGNDVFGPPPSVAGGTSIEISIQGLSMGAWDKAIDLVSFRNMLSTACRGMHDYHWLPGEGGPCFVAPVRPLNKLLGSASAPYTQQYTSGDPYGVPGGMAPDIFTNDNDDNYQIPHLILAALKTDPAHTQAWASIHRALGTTTIEEAISDLFAMITSDKLKWTSGWNSVLGYLQDVSDNTIVVPAAGSASFVGIAPDLTFSSTTATPAAGTATFLGVDPTVLDGPRVAVPDPAVATFAGVDPTVLTSSITVTPTAAVVTLQGVDPAVGLSSMVVAPTAGSASFLGVDPTVNVGGRTAPLEPGVAEFLGVDPAVTLSSTASSPDPALATFAAVDPGVVFTSLVLIPEVGIVTFLAEDPAPIAPISVTPSAGVATFRALDPAVLDSDTALVSSTVTLMGSITSVLTTLRGKV